MAKKQQLPKTIAALTHADAKRKNLPTAEMQSVMQKGEREAVKVAYARGAHGLEDEKQQRNRDLDPQLVWRGKDQQDWSDLVVNAPPLYIQEKVHPKALIDDLKRRSEAGKGAQAGTMDDLFADFNGIPEGADKTEFYQHDANWQNRMILGDSLQVMASLAEREGLRGQVQCIYFDPPYGIKFNSNFQWSTTSRDVKDGNTAHITREPEQVKAFRDTWRDGIHSYLTYLRDRLTVARDLLTESGSIFVQIGEENVHRVRGVMDEVFGDDHLIAQINVLKTATPSALLDDNFFYLLWYGKNRKDTKFRTLLLDKPMGEWVSETRGGSWGLKSTPVDYRPLEPSERDDPTTIPQGEVYALSKTNSAGPAAADRPFVFRGKAFSAGANAHWKTTSEGMERLVKADRLETRGGPPWMRKFHSDSPFKRMTNAWLDTSGKSTLRWYVVQTDTPIIQRCVLMASDPGDLVLDPTCGSGTTAYVAEQWGRRWITIDTSRVALALARARIMGARYPFYLLADSLEGQQKEADVTRTVPKSAATWGNIRHGFVYERVPHITLKSIGKNAEIDVIWDKYQQVLEPLREKLNKEEGTHWAEWEIPRSNEKLSLGGKVFHEKWWQQRIARQKEIDASIATKAEYEYLYDKPYDDKRKVRVAGPFTVESLLPHRVLGVDENDELIDGVGDEKAGYGDSRDFVQIILEALRVAGVQQAHKEDRIIFTTLTPWPGSLICAEGRYTEGDKEKRAAVFIGPEFGTVSRPDLVSAAREAGDADFDVLIACAFNYDAHSTDFAKLGRIPVLKARMNADLHMAEDLKNTGKGNLFVIFGEPDIDILDADPDSAPGQLRVKVNGVDVFKPNLGKIESSSTDEIACWFIDTDYNEESFFVRHAYFLGANDPYKALKTTLKAEIDEDAWTTLHSDISRPFDKPTSGRIAVKVINHLGDEVMKVFKVT
ncbi:site-specific DNA-methyltransferase [Dokdonella sp.]|uniref:site-specific DNA-methyltransferase n=1 Tax=Dokdonella sp. TaxID=2291710 RepID=UPI001B1E25EC|nr:site-specific DNA-methyltransferase [Dokdonella sp.]MBO9664946.1 site-specific DNA-methyltransferase [Dokdonella sp.]